MPTTVDGKVEFIQETEFSSSSIQIELKGLSGKAGKYGIYSVKKEFFSLVTFKWCVGAKVPVKPDLQFPCTQATLGNVHNPLNATTTPDIQTGTSDQYPIGDLSSKFGELAGFNDVHAVFNDTNLPLYGQTSIIGRSFVLNRADDNER